MEIDLTEAIEAADVELCGRITTDISDGETRREVADAAVRAAAPLIERAVRAEPRNLKQVGWLTSWTNADDSTGNHLVIDEEHPPGPNWRRVYVMITAEEREAIHGGSDG